MLLHKFSQLSAIILLSSLVALAQEPAKPAAPPPIKSTAPEPAAPNPETPAPKPEAAAAAVPAGAPVITIKNMCGGPQVDVGSTSSQECATTISKEQFEQLINAVVPKARRTEMPNNMKQNMARQLGQLLVMVHAAEQRGLEKDPEVQQRLKIQRDSALAQALNVKLQEDATPSDAEIDKYYKDNPSAFEEVTLQRLFIPKAVASKDKPVDATTEKAAAEKLHARAVAGEDFDKLQKAAYVGNANPQAAPNTQMGGRRRGGLPPDQEGAIFALKQGGVSELYDTPGGYTVYKLIGKRTVPLAETKDEISRKLQQQKFKDAMTALTGSAPISLNEAYFGKEEAMPAMPGMGSMPMNVHRMPEQPSSAATPAPPAASKKPVKPKTQTPPPPPPK